MFLMTKAGRRGCVWGLVVCQYWGRQHSIMKRVRNASNFERLFISVPFVPVYQLHQLQKPCKVKQDSQVSGSHRYEFPFTWSRRELSKEQSRFFLWCVSEPLKTIDMTWRVRGGLSLSKWCIALHPLLFFLILQYCHVWCQNPQRHPKLCQYLFPVSTEPTSTFSTAPVFPCFPRVMPLPLSIRMC